MPNTPVKTDDEIGDEITMWDILEENRISLKKGEVHADLITEHWWENALLIIAQWEAIAQDFFDPVLRRLSPTWRGFMPNLYTITFPVTGEYILFFSWALVRVGPVTVCQRRAIRV